MSTYLDRLRVLGCGLILLILLGAVSGCAPVVPAAAPEEASAPAEEEVPEETAAPAEEEVLEEWNNTFYLERQIIVTGPITQVNAAITNPDISVYDPVLVDTIDLDFLTPSLRNCDEISDGYISGEYDDYTMDLYQFGEVYDASVPEIASAINNLRLPEVYAEPNYLIGRVRATGSPWTVGGSPWTVGGSPWTVGGSPGTGPVCATVDEGTFVGQWALEQLGHGLEQYGEASPDANVLVGVFDTLPHIGLDTIPAPTIQSIPVGGIEQRNERLGAPEGITEACQEPPVTPCIPVDQETGNKIAEDVYLAPESLPEATGEPSFADHGLSVAALINAVSPLSDIYMYRVLDDHVQGDLFTLNQALAHFLRALSGSSDVYSGAVVNLSLGVRSPPTWDGAYNLPEEAQSLRTMLVGAFCDDIVTVAATGNDEGAEPDIPAAWTPIVIGVGGRNYQRDQSCFSNIVPDGGVLAPGGDGDEVDGNPCWPVLSQCQGDCEYAVISRAAECSSGFAYWAGTSFATPLASGIVARVLEQHPYSHDHVWTDLPDILSR